MSTSTTKQDVAKTRQAKKLATLATTANEEHKLATGAMKTMLGHAIKAGKALNAAKAQVGHGGWGAWLGENFKGSQRSAQVYMSLAEDPQRAADLPETSIRGALTRARSDRPKKATKLPTVAKKPMNPGEVIRKFGFSIDELFADGDQVYTATSQMLLEMTDDLVEDDFRIILDALERLQERVSNAIDQWKGARGPEQDGKPELPTSLDKRARQAV